MADGHKDKTHLTAGILLHRVEPGEAPGNCAILPASAQLVVDTRNTINVPLPHVFRLGSPRPQALEAEPLEDVEPVEPLIT